MLNLTDTRINTIAGVWKKEFCVLDKDQIYIVVDIETDGPIPGVYSMLSIGAVASSQEEEISTFYRKLKPLPQAKRDSDTMKWWKGQPEAWEEVCRDMENPRKVMEDFCKWIHDLGKTPIFVSSPLAFDYSFVAWYLHTLLEQNPFFDYSGVQRTLDLASLTSGYLKLPLAKSRRSQLDSSFKEGMPGHSHKAIDDARGYAVMLRNLLNS